MPMRLRGNSPPFSGLGLGQPANCSAVGGGCQACLDFGRAAAAAGDGGGGCVWCPQEGGCVSAVACPTAAGTCPVNYVWIVCIWLVLSALICLCCITCTTRRCVDEWRQRLRPSGARGSNSLGSIDAGGSPRQRRQRQRQRDAHRHDSLYEPLLMNAGAAADSDHSGANQRQRQGRAVGRASEEDGDGDEDEEAEEQEHRAAVFRNSLFADAGEREWVCAICAFENRPRVSACSLCGTTQEAGLRWQEQERKYEERRAAAFTDARDDGSDTLWQDPEQQLTLRQRAARHRRRWQRRVVDGGGGDGSVTWVRVPLKESLGLSTTSTGITHGHGAKQEQLLLLGGPAAGTDAIQEEEEAAAAQVLSLASRMRRRLFLPFVRRSTSPRATSTPPDNQGAAGRDEEEEGEEGDDDRRSSSSFSFSSLFRGSHDHDSSSDGAGGRRRWRPRRKSEGGLSSASFASFASPTPLLEETKEEGAVPAGAVAVAVDDDDGGLGSFVSAMQADREGGFEWVPASSSQQAQQPQQSQQSSPPPPRWQTMWRAADLVSLAALRSFRKKHFWFVEALRVGGVQAPWAEGHVRLRVARARLLEDSFGQLMSLRPHQVRLWLRVQFADEPGVDAGGLEREWFLCVAQALTDAALGLFVLEPTGYGINPAALHAFGAGTAKGRRLALQHYYFAGRVFGKALIEHQTLPARLSLPLRKQLLGAPLGLADLEAADPALHRSLRWMLREARPEEVAGLHLDFTASSDALGLRVVRELRPGGAQTPLTFESREEYARCMLQDRLLESVRPQLWWLLKGFYEAVPRALLQVFDPEELGLLLNGVPTIDIDDWRRHTEYLGEFARLGERHRVIRWWWEVVEHGLDEAQRARLLQFATGGCSVPAQGFKALQSNDGCFRRFNIQSVRRQDLCYPRAHTCFNKLDLPVYESKEELATALQLVLSLDDIATGFTID